MRNDLSPKMVIITENLLFKMEILKTVTWPLDVHRDESAVSGAGKSTYSRFYDPSSAIIYGQVKEGSIKIDKQDFKICNLCN
jgi:hypothetical protein